MLLESGSAAPSVLTASRPGLRVLRADDPRDRALWLRAWRRCADRDIFSHPAYLTERAGETALPRAVTYVDSLGSLVLYAFLQRPVTHDGCGRRLSEACSDITTPLLYGGPQLALAPGGTETAVMTAFWDRFRDWARTENVVAEFHRVNPVSGCRPGYPGIWREQAPHVVKAIGGRTEQDLLLDASKGFRRNVRRTHEAGMQLLIDETGEYLEVFGELYRETMLRTGADSRFFHGKDFFEAMQGAFAGQIAYLFALDGGRPVSTEMVLFCGRTAYSFLGATEQDSLSSGANSFLSHRAFCYAQTRGVEDYVLTGGVTNTDEDSLLRYKLSLARSGRRTYCTAEQVIDEERYAALSPCRPGPAFFPAYRTPGPACSGSCVPRRGAQS